MGDRLAATDMGRKLGAVSPFLGELSTYKKYQNSPYVVKNLLERPQSTY